MPLFDLSLDDLRVYQPRIDAPDDFDTFWAESLAETRAHPLNARFERVDIGLRTLDVEDVTFAGWNGEPIKGWFIRPAGASAPLPAIVEYIGYGGGRGTPIHWLAWPSAGYAYLVMDTRGQGSTWLRGDTPDTPTRPNPAYPGYMTQGILDPHDYYYRRVFCDAVRAVEVLQGHPLVAADRIGVTGASQGGAITLAVGGLVPSLKAVMPDVPFLCHFGRAVELSPDAPYTEIVKYLSVHRDKTAQVMRTLAYFDGVHFAQRITAPALFSTALMDTVCPPSTVFAAYNRVPGAKAIRVYPFNNHEGGSEDHLLEKITFAGAQL